MWLLALALIHVTYPICVSFLFLSGDNDKSDKKQEERAQRRDIQKQQQQRPPGAVKRAPSDHFDQIHQ